MTIAVVDYLLGRGTPFLLLPDPGSESPESTAARHDVSTDELVRTVALRFRFGLALAVLPWTSRLDLDLVRDALDDAEARPAAPPEVAGLADGCVPDCLPPLGLWLQAPMFVDAAVDRLPQVVFPAGRPSVLVCMERDELFRDDPYAVVSLGRAPHGTMSARSGTIGTGISH
ncbi:MAG TPA: YbaK/EbsC family protein [Actinomycetota bacterium]